MKDVGVVERCEGEEAVVTVTRHEACGTCGACNKSSAGTLQVTAHNEAGAEQGDRVELTVEVTDFMKAVFLIYALPAIGLVLGMAAAYAAAPSLGITRFREPFSALIGLLLMFALFILARVYGKRHHGSYSASITGIKK